MPCAGPFHFDLPAAVARVDIVELLLPAQPGVAFYFGIEELVDVQGQLLAADEEPEVIEGSELIVVQVLLRDILLQHLRSEEQHRAHLEVIADRAELAADQRHRTTLPVGGKRVMVGEEHQCLAVLSNCEESCQGMIAELQGVVLTI